VLMKGGILLSLPDYKISYPTNISWKCLRCGLCCQDTAGHTRRIRLLSSEASEISKRTGIPVQELVTHPSDEPYPYEMRKKDGKCQFLEKKVCRIYAYRPLVCRFYPFEMKSDRDWLEIRQARGTCIGVDQGRKLNKTFFRKLAAAAIGRFRYSSSMDADSG
jgi:Fe-S-cluster containining protein